MERGVRGATWLPGELKHGKRVLGLGLGLGLPARLVMQVTTHALQLYCRIS